MIDPVSGYFDAWFLADQPDSARAVKAEQVARLLRECGQQTISISEDLQQAYRRARVELREGDQMVVFGSFRTVGAILPLLDGDVLQ